MFASQIDYQVTRNIIAKLMQYAQLIRGWFCPSCFFHGWFPNRNHSLTTRPTFSFSLPWDRIGFGSELFARGIELANSTLANELHPDVVIGIHSDYIKAGADAIGTNTFVASELHLEMAGKEASDVNGLVRTSVDHARAAFEKCGREVYIAGSIGPSPGAIEADAGCTEFGIPNSRVRSAHQRVIETLADAGVDFLNLETMFSATEAAMIVDIARHTGLPIAVNMTYKYTRNRETGDFTYRTDWGHSAVDLVATLRGDNGSGYGNLLEHVQIFGLNCGAESRRKEHTGMPYAVNGIRQLRSALSEFALDEKRLMAYPNAGIPHLDKRNQTIYSQTPEEMEAQIGELLGAGAYFIGGCCGTGPEHIRAFRAAVDAHERQPLAAAV